jgi:VWFA-related protein
MRRLCAAAVVVAAAALAAAAGAPARAQGEAHQRHVLVSVSHDGTPVKDLTAADFTVREDGVTREVLHVEPATAPFQLALLVDNSDASQPIITDLRAALATFSRELLAAIPGSNVAFMTVGERPTLEVEFTPSATLLTQGINRLFARIGSGAYLLEALTGTAKDLQKRGARRPVIVSFTIESGPEFSNATHTDVANALEQAGAALWTIVLQQGPPPDLSVTAMRERAIVLTDVATQSGGANSLVLSRQGLQPAFVKVAALLTSEYDVTYGRPESTVPPSRLGVGVTRRDVDVRAPHWAGQ